MPAALCGQQEAVRRRPTAGRPASGRPPPDPGLAVLVRSSAAIALRRRDDQDVAADLVGRAECAPVPAGPDRPPLARLDVAVGKTGKGAAVGQLVMLDVDRGQGLVPDQPQSGHGDRSPADTSATVGWCSRPGPGAGRRSARPRRLGRSRPGRAGGLSQRANTGRSRSAASWSNRSSTNGARSAYAKRLVHRRLASRIGIFSDLGRCPDGMYYRTRVRVGMRSR
jgi:hypothetical protein